MGAGTKVVDGYRLWLMAGVCAGALLAGQAGAQEADRLWQPWVEFGAIGSNDLSRGEATVFAPLAQDADTLTFVEGTGRVFQDNILEGNIAFGLRQILDAGIIVGGWAGYDVRRTEAGNTFNQLSFGVEAMTERFDARFNGYVPFSDSAPSLTGASVVQTGNRIFITGGEEIPLHGFDGEVGMKIFESSRLENFFSNAQHELRVYGGGYYFNDDAAPEAIAGPRVRAEYRINDVFSGMPGSRLTAEAQFQHDTVRGNQWSGGLALRIPLGGWGDRDALERGQEALSPLQQRMTEGLVRDPDIVTTQSGDENVRDSETGVDFDRVAHVDAGDDLSTVAEDAGSNTLLIADGGTRDGAGVLQDDQTLMGGGATIYVTGVSTGLTLPFTAPGSMPTFRNTGNTAVLTIGRNAHVTGVGLEGSGLPIGAGDGNIGIFASGELGTTVLTNNEILNTGDRGIQLVLEKGTNRARVAGNTIRSAHHGIEFNTRGDSENTITVEDNTVTSSEKRGLTFNLPGQSRNGVAVRNNTFDTAEEGITATFADESESAFSVADNTVTANTIGGLWFNFSDQSRGNTLAVTGNTVSSKATGNGISVWVGDDSSSDISVEDNTVTSAASRGLDFGLSGNGQSSTMSVTGNTVTSQDQSIRIGLEGNSSAAEIAVFGNTVTNSQFSAIQYFDLTGTTVGRVAISNNTVEGGNSGLSVISESAWLESLTISGNTANSNGSSGIAATLRGGNVDSLVTIEDNSIDRSARGGVEVALQGSDVGTLAVKGNRIKSDREGIDIAAFGDNNSTILVEDNTVEEATEQGLLLTFNHNSQSDLTVKGNRVTSELEGIRISLKDSSSASGISVTGNTVTSTSGNGIQYGADSLGTVDNATISGNTIEGAGGVGVDVVSGASGPLDFFIISDNIIGNASGGGIAVDSNTMQQGSFTVSGNRIADVSGFGIETVFGGVDISELTISGNVIERATRTGILADIFNTDLETFAFSGNTVIGAEGDGIGIEVQNGTAGEMSITGNRVEGSLQHGAQLVLNTQDVNAFTFSENEIIGSGSGHEGLDVDFEGGIFGDVRFDQNTINNADNDGAKIALTQGMFETVSFDHNMIDGSASDGVAIELLDGTFGTVSVDDNTVDNSGNDGMDVRNYRSIIDALAITANKITTAANEGIEVVARPNIGAGATEFGSLTISGNTVKDIEDAGIRLSTDMVSIGTASISDNTATDLRGHGYSLSFLNATAETIAISGNSATGVTGAAGSPRHGFSISANNLTADTFTVSANSATDVTGAMGSERNGFRFDMGPMDIETLSVTGNEATNVQDNGLNIFLGFSSSVGTMSVNDNKATTSGANGFIFDFDGAIAALEINGNQAEGSGARGLSASLDNLNAGSIAFDGNILTNSGTDGLAIDPSNLNAGVLSVTGNSATDSGGNGFVFELGGVVTLLAINDNRAERSGSQGLAASFGAANVGGSLNTVLLSLSSNTLINSVGNGVFLDLLNVDADLVSVSGNTVTASTAGSGMRVNLEGNTDVELFAIAGNTVSDNAAYGVFIRQVDNAVATVQMDTNAVSHAGSNELLRLDVFGNAQGTYQFKGNEFLSVSGNSISLVAAGSPVLDMQFALNTMNVDALFLKGVGGVFQLEDTLGSNTLQDGAVINVTPNIGIVPAGTFFPFP